MKRSLSDENPYQPGRYAYLWEILRAQPPGRHLDVGCYNAAVLKTLLAGGVIAEGVGVDVNRESLAAASQDSPEGLALHHQQRVGDLDLETIGGEPVDSVSLLDVLEHIYDPEQPDLLRRIHAVLKPGGLFIVTVPGQHLFSFLDTGNVKFRFPRIHRWLYIRARGVEAYRKRYEEAPDGLIGDIDARKRWHQHFRRRELVSLVEPHGFRLVDADGTGYFHRLFLVVFWPFPKLRNRIRRWDLNRFCTANLFFTFGKAD